MKLSPKVPAEIIPVTFDFSDLLTTIDSVSTVGVFVVTGTDADVATMLLGSASIQGSSVVQLVRNGVAGCTYRLHCLVQVGSEKYQIDGDLPVIAWHTK